MPSIKDQTTVEAIAREYCSNGRNKGDALQTIGYSDTYAKESGRGCSVVFSNVHVIAAIKAIDEENAEKAGYSVEQCQREYEEVRQAAIKAGQLSAAATAITGKARLYGMDKQTTVAEHVPDQPTGQEAEAIEQAAKQYKVRLAKQGS